MVYYLGIDGKGMYEDEAIQIDPLPSVCWRAWWLCTGFANEEGNLIANA